MKEKMIPMKCSNPWREEQKLEELFPEKSEPEMEMGE